MNQTEKELEFLKIKKQGVQRSFNHYVDNYKHSAIYLVALVVGFVGMSFPLGFTDNIHFIIIGGLAILMYKFVMVWMKTNDLNKIEKKINDSMEKRFKELGVNVKAIEKEIGLKV